MKIILSDTLLNSHKNRASSFSIKQTRVGYLGNAIDKNYALISDKKNISYKVSFSIESNLSSNFEANLYALEHCSFLSSLESFELKIQETSLSKKKEYSTSFNSAILTNFSFITNNNTVNFNYEFLSSNIEFSN